MAKRQTAKPRVERRAFGRRRSCIHGYILIPGRPPSPCIVRDFSAAGAALELSERLDPPYNFALDIDGPDEPIACEVRHLRDFRMGVRFKGDGIRERLERVLAGATGGRRKRARSKPEGQDEPQSPPRRVTGQELRRTVLGQV